MTEEEKDNARTEYIATNDAYLHYDNFSWQVGAVLIAGAFVYWGFLLDSSPKLLVVNIGNLLITIVMSIWILYCSHNQEIYLYKLHRIRQLERKLGMFQHLRFREEEDIKERYIRNGVKGHHLNYLLYITVTIGSLVFGWSVSNHCCCSWDYINIILFCSVPLLIVIVMSIVIFTNEKTNQVIKSLEDKEKS